mgnify:CR=1 FL=1
MKGSIHPVLQIPESRSMQEVWESVVPRQGFILWILRRMAADGNDTCKTYDPDREIPILVEAGDYIRFVPIDEDEYKRIRELVERGEYQCTVHEEA